MYKMDDVEGFSSAALWIKEKWFGKLSMYKSIGSIEDSKLFHEASPAELLRPVEALPIPRLTW